MGSYFWIPKAQLKSSSPFTFLEAFENLTPMQAHGMSLRSQWSAIPMGQSTEIDAIKNHDASGGSFGIGTLKHGLARRLEGVSSNRRTDQRMLCGPSGSEEAQVTDTGMQGRQERSDGQVWRGRLSHPTLHGNMEAESATRLFHMRRGHSLRPLRINYGLLLLCSACHLIDVVS